jgi:hypothetical protein
MSGFANYRASVDIGLVSEIWRSHQGKIADETARGTVCPKATHFRRYIAGEFRTRCSARLAKKGRFSRSQGAEHKGV